MASTSPTNTTITLDSNSRGLQYSKFDDDATNGDIDINCTVDRNYNTFKADTSLVRVQVEVYGKTSAGQPQADQSATLENLLQIMNS